jgi:hypothetical protein
LVSISCSKEQQKETTLPDEVQKGEPKSQDMPTPDNTEEIGKQNNQSNEKIDSKIAKDTNSKVNNSELEELKKKI